MLCRKDHLRVSLRLLEGMRQAIAVRRVGLGVAVLRLGRKGHLQVSPPRLGGLR